MINHNYDYENPSPCGFDPTLELLLQGEEMIDLRATIRDMEKVIKDQKATIDAILLLNTQDFLVTRN